MANHKIIGLSEVNIRVRDLEKMRKFYVGVLGLKPYKDFRKYIFLQVPKRSSGRTQYVNLFHHSFDREKLVPDIRRTTLHHLAFEIPLRDFKAEKERLKKLSLDVIEYVHKGFPFRSLYFDDPEGNMLEFVSYDNSIIVSKTSGL
jgi:catechol-2,3-dioxygenase